MDWKGVGNAVIKAGAPLLGGALFGPAGAAVGSIIAAQFGVSPDAITMVMCAMFGAIVGALFIWAIPGENKDIVVYMAGQVSGILTSCVTYWVGSTRASANKDMIKR